MKILTIIGIGALGIDLIANKKEKSISKKLELVFEGAQLLFPEVKVFKGLKYASKAFGSIFNR